MAASMESSSAMSAAATVEASASMEVPSAVKTAALEAVRVPTAMETFVAMKLVIPMPAAVSVPTALAAEAVVTAKTVTVSVPAAPVKAVPSAVIAGAVKAVEPRPCANEDSADKIVRAVVSVRGARVRSIVVITVRAVRRRTDVNRAGRRNNSAESHPEPNLSMSRSQPRNKYQSCQSNCVF
jgi:hypothetical protein